MASKQSHLTAHEVVAVVRAKIKFYEDSLRFKAQPASREAHKALFPSLRRHWPEMDQKPRQYRLDILMALLGRSLTSQNDLYWHEVRACLEVLNNDGIFAPDGVCAEEISMAIEGAYSGEAFNFPGLIITA